ncbi:hypothetical protein PN300_00520 [Pediococcus acidilactici]|jgi:hypothetical protein|nr:hypothetical protein [Pediococcus acidilactici]MDB8858387.1 hypothetical protein [Pediococcus acidilactici]MDB8861421.1 hypothetical protein [Pediococcus acidilactici]MDB8866869.1 hypothetical protein [Pediococcus acidilactici]
MPEFGVTIVFFVKQNQLTLGARFDFIKGKTPADLAFAVSFLWVN